MSYTIDTAKAYQTLQAWKSQYKNRVIVLFEGTPILGGKCYISEKKAMARLKSMHDHLDGWKEAIDQMVKDGKITFKSFQ